MAVRRRQKPILQVVSVYVFTFLEIWLAKKPRNNLQFFTMISDTKNLLVKWTPRTIASLLGGYYGLGVAYDLGLMALIDQIAIRFIKHFFGYGGIGALMPTVQWYSAWGVRLVLGITSAISYDCLARMSSLMTENLSAGT